MAELGFQDRLQPALLDRLCDDARCLRIVEVRTTRGVLEDRGVSIEALELALRPFDLRPLAGDRYERRAESADGALVLLFSGPSDIGTVTRALAAPVATGGDPVSVAQCAEVSAKTITNFQLETLEQRTLSVRKLRESVLRDLSWLLSTISLDTSEDLTDLPEVERSVLNYGLPSVAGLGSGKLDPVQAAKRLQATIERFEPRLTKVRVTAEFDSTRVDLHALKFRVEAELWGQPTPQQLILRTRIDVESADVVITDFEAG